MASSRLFLIALLASSVAFVLSSKAPTNIIVGNRIFGDRLIQREFLKVPYKFLRMVAVNKTYNGDYFSTITQVRILDQNQRGDGAKATIIYGGPSFDFVSVHFESNRGCGINFIIEIYGK